ncbi:MAG: cysteine desulfurase [Chloroflexi bacterium]|nr:cysteine desulfurase [Chloroflexota bacterium]
MVYLDYNATTPVDPAVLKAMAPFWNEYFINPSSPYLEADTARAAVAEARQSLAGLLGAATDEVVFTSGGTESDNWALRGGVSSWHGQRRRLLISAFEHPAVAETAAALGAEGMEVAIIPVDQRGVIVLEALDTLLDERTAVVSVMLANNEIGTVQPVAAIVEKAHAVGALVHTDAAQAVGKIPVDVRALGVDLLTVAGHKLYAPKGIGALYIRRGVRLPPLLAGGGQEGGRRSGTENVPGIVGLGAAAGLARNWLMQGGAERQAALRDRFEEKLLREIPGIVIFGQEAARLPNTAAFAIAGWRGAELLAACPSVQAATGSACHHPDDAGSPVIRALGYPAEVARRLVRVSLGRSTGAEEVVQAAAALLAAARSRSS